MRRHGAVPEVYVCRCGYATVVWRLGARRRPRGHVKTMWCPMCGAMRGFVKRGR